MSIDYKPQNAILDHFFRFGGSYVYLATDPMKADVQEKALQIEHVPLPAEVAVQILVAFIQNTGTDLLQLKNLFFKKQGHESALCRFKRQTLLCCAKCIFLFCCGIHRHKTVEKRL